MIMIMIIIYQVWVPAAVDPKFGKWDLADGIQTPTPTPNILK